MKADLEYKFELTEVTVRRVKDKQDLEIIFEQMLEAGRPEEMVTDLRLKGVHLNPDYCAHLGVIATRIITVMKVTP